MTEPGWTGGVNRLVALVGRRVLDDAAPHVVYATIDSIRHFARAYGDGNPLYTDPLYAAAGPRGGLVAPPLFAIATGVPLPPPDDEPTVADIARVLGSGEPTVVSDVWSLHRPITEGLRLERVSVLQSVEADADESPLRCDVTVRTRYQAAGWLYATHDRTRRYQPARRAPIGPQPPRASYTPEALARIDDGYEVENRRGAEPRWIEDVATGDRLGPLVKGPLTITDLVSYRAGVGPGPLGAETLGLAHFHRARRPELYAPDPSNVPDTVERRHWDETYARSLDYTTAYDYSHTRLTWFSHLLGDWMGDGGWLSEISASTTGFNYLGDTHWLTGVVVEVNDDGRRGAVRIDVEGRNQRDEVTCQGVAIVLLPRRPAIVAPAE